MDAPLPPDVADALMLLGYSRRWLDYGVLTPEVLLTQARDFRSLPQPEDGREHYRHGAVYGYLMSADVLTDVQLTNVIQLMESDTDAAMAGSVIGNLLLAHPGLTDTQFERVSSHPSVRAQVKKIERIRLQRLRRACGATEAWFRAAVDLPDHVTHRAVLAEESVPRWAVEYLATHGVNKGVKNRAAELLRGPPFRS